MGLDRVDCIFIGYLAIIIAAQSLVNTYYITKNQKNITDNQYVLEEKIIQTGKNILNMTIHCEGHILEEVKKSEKNIMEHINKSSIS